MSKPITAQLRPSGAFIAGSYASLGIGALGFIIGLWNATMQMNEKGFYFAVLMFGLFSAVSLQKTVRDKLEGLPVSGAYSGICYVSFGMAILLLSVGLWNANLTLSEKGFYFMSFGLALFAAVAVQKNVRDVRAYEMAFGRPELQEEDNASA